uniref:C2H2-type domain-containing protein n=1 Tax=Callithrix jacchus TaxID=9483 RepID=A0A8I3WK45_CALJA
CTKQYINNSQSIAHYGSKKHPSNNRLKYGLHPGDASCKKKKLNATNGNDADKVRKNSGCCRMCSLSFLSSVSDSRQNRGKINQRRLVLVISSKTILQTTKLRGPLRCDICKVSINTIHNNRSHMKGSKTQSLLKRK